MRKIIFYNASKLMTCLLILALTITSCKKQAVEINYPANPDALAASSKGKPSSLSTVSLKVTVTDAGNKITSDLLGDYINGAQNVRAVIDNTGNFVFNTNNSPKSPVRKLNFDFSQLLQAGTGTPPPTNTSKNYLVQTVNTSSQNFIPLQNLGVNGNPTSECIALRTEGLTGITIDWRGIFHAGFDDTSTSPTSYASVTRTDANHWTITALGNCAPATTQNEAAFRSGDAQILYGYYSLPFSFTLTAQ